MGQVVISGTAYQVYGDEAGFKSYMGGKLDSGNYDDASSNDRKKALVTATRWIDREHYDGAPTSPTQDPSAFPRTGLTDCDGNAVDSGTVPTEVDEACYELANILLGDPSAADSSSTGSNVKSAKAGSAQVEFFRPGSSDGSGSGGVFPPLAQKLLRCFMGSPGISGPTASGTGQGSSFCDDDYSRDGGFA